MTAEIAILNKSAVALAADSAVSVGARKVYNSANKLFTLSKIHPVGVMIYGNAEWMGIPWETLIKYFRNQVLRDASFGTTREYANAFIKFLRETSIVEKNNEREWFRDLVAFQLVKVRDALIDGTKRLAQMNSRFTQTQATEILDSILKSRIGDLEAQGLLDEATDEDIQLISEQGKSDFSKSLEGLFSKYPLSEAHRSQLLRLCALCALSKRFYNMSGVVFAGFGAQEIFPSLSELRIEGRINGKLKYTVGHDGSIDTKRNAWIVPFAQSEMVSTFMNGIHPDLEEIMEKFHARLFRDMPAILHPRSKSRQDALAERLSAIKGDMRNMLEAFSSEQFVMPILNSVSALPKDELAAMAEALVNLTSFRRRVTPDAESVGGPIDVAVISKGDGFV